MQKTVQEIMDMITNGELHYNQSTQRKFIYADMEVKMPGGGKTTKSGSLINAILENNIQLPAVYFWYNTDTKQLNIHDGKQRLLSLYYFINPTAQINITTPRNGKPMIYGALEEKDQKKLLNYLFDIVYREGTSAEEEISFDLINSNSVNLTKYECLSGMFHGTFLDEFEKYVNAMSKNLDEVKSVERGEQAYKFLLTCFGINNSKQAGEDASNLALKDCLRPIRNNSFDASAFKFDEILILFNDLMKVVKGIKEDRALILAAFIIREYHNFKDKIVDFYRQSMRLINDIPAWDCLTHKTFIRSYIDDNISLDPQRYFTKDIKDQLYARSPRCAHVDADGTRCKETSYSKLEVDHIIPWSKGGKTIIDNAQLLCKHHNTSKGNN